MREIVFNMDSAKEQIKLLQGKPVTLSVNRGRNRFVSFEGQIESLYPAVFTVREASGGIMTYSYSDVLTSNVRLVPSKGD